MGSVIMPVLVVLVYGGLSIAFGRSISIYEALMLAATWAVLCRLDEIQDKLNAYFLRSL